MILAESNGAHHRLIEKLVMMNKLWSELLDKIKLKLKSATFIYY